jgi:hypothetical protein
VDGCNVKVDGFMDGRMDGWMEGRMDGWMDGWMDGFRYRPKCTFNDNNILVARQLRECE